MRKRFAAMTPTILDGRIESLRVSVPLVMGDIHLRVDGVPVTGTIEDAAKIRTLRGLQEQAAPVRIGVLTDSKGDHHFAWLIARKGPGVPPRFYRDEKRNAWRTTGIGLTIAVLAIAGAWLLGLSSAWRAVALAVLLAVALMGVIIAGLSLHGLWFNRVHRAAILKSEAAYRDHSGKPLSVMPAVTPVQNAVHKSGSAPVPDQPHIQAADTQAADTEPPPMQRVQGTLTSLTHETRRSVNSGPSFGVFRFLVGRQAYIMTVGENLGDVKPFLAEGDRVDMAVLAQDVPGGGPHRLVYAMRNLEDGRVYVCHHGFRGGNGHIAPVGVGLAQRVPLLKTVGGLLLFTWLLLISISYFDRSPGDYDDLAALGTYSLLGFVAIWFCFALPFVYLDWRWRKGRPTKRQRIVERVYLTLGLGTPFAPTERIEEV
ncbi:hypothetical protein FXN63_11690 [Pigmentiphaga aceris]|uniref:Uncharacterized protein n=1 Tax=Pigmentiphaga aceris TaxID=1940612 RepID=A0A5C0AVP2_9BURK|nr:hypothetical protein [Pigmentiphaga aceris]QEI06418.1 hypothetical protein FXN63_11690 [Pigmentiphaga aceris]